MSSRKNVHVVLREVCDPGKSPNATVGQITVDIRIVFPPHVDRRGVWDLYRRAVVQAERELFPEERATSPATLDDVQGILGAGWAGGMDSVDWIRGQRDV